MSQNELHTGRLEVVSYGFERERFKNFMEVNDLGCDHDVMEEDFFFLFDKNDVNKFVFNKGILYNILEWTEHDDPYYVSETKKVGSQIHFTYMFYNGGTWEGELLEEGLDNLNT